MNKNNPFTEGNEPPKDHLVPEKILEKPGKIKNLESLKSNKPLAGKFSEIGERVFEAGDKKAFLITTGPWGEILMKDSAAQ